MSTQDGGLSGTYITRDEFAGFERSVTRSFSEMSNQIAGLSQKMDDVRGRGPDIKAILMAVSVVAGLLSVVWGAIQWGIVEKMKTQDTAILRLVERVDEHSTHGGHATALTQIQGLAQTVNRLENDFATDESWGLDHEARVAALNEKQNGRITSLEGRTHRIESDLSARAGQRWNRPDHDREVRPYLEEHRKEIADLKTTVAVMGRALERLSKDSP